VKPDYTGEYVLNREASTLSPLGAANVTTASLRISHVEPQFKCEGRFTLRNGATTQWAFKLTIEEASTGPTDGTSTIRWDGRALIAVMETGGPTIIFRYELEGGRLRLAEQLRGTDHDQDNVWIFERS
jgi:hypothetical protein